MMYKESWQRFNSAINHYDALGFEYYRFAQWAVTEEVVNITKPKGSQHFFVGSGSLVGSAEQSFLQDYEELGNGLYYAITPCFRDEQDISEIHLPYFMKLELFSRDTLQFDYIVASAMDFFMSQVPYSLRSKLEILDTGEFSCDILYGNVEIGSYYHSKHKDMEWVCGTGLAEPRFNYLLP